MSEHLDIPFAEGMVDAMLFSLKAQEGKWQH